MGRNGVAAYGPGSIWNVAPVLMDGLPSVVVHDERPVKAFVSSVAAAAVFASSLELPLSFCSFYYE